MTNPSWLQALGPNLKCLKFPFSFHAFELMLKDCACLHIVGAVLTIDGQAGGKRLLHWGILLILPFSSLPLASAECKI